MKALKPLATIAVAALLSACSSMGTVNSASLYSQLGGKEAVSKLSSNLLSSATTDPRLSSLLGKVDVGAATPKINDQFCAALGGGCKAAFSPEQLSSAAKKLNPSQASASAEGALLLFDCEKVDCLVVDLNLPAMSGLDLIDRLRERHVEVPAVVISAQDGPRIRAAARARGVSDFLAKPFLGSALIRVLDRLCVA